MRKYLKVFNLTNRRNNHLLKTLAIAEKLVPSSSSKCFTNNMSKRPAPNVNSAGKRTSWNISKVQATNYQPFIADSFRNKSSSTEKPILCPRCSACFKSEKDQLEHQRISHPDTLQGSNFGSNKFSAQKNQGGIFPRDQRPRQFAPRISRNSSLVNTNRRITTSYPELEKNSDNARIENSYTNNMTMTKKERTIQNTAVFGARQDKNNVVDKRNNDNNSNNESIYDMIDKSKKTRARKGRNIKNKTDNNNDKFVKQVKYDDLNEEQKTVYSSVMTGNSIFLTGAAGTGKSHVLLCILQNLLRKYREKEIAITASTGIAACDLKGQTVHSFAGIGLAKDGIDEVVDKALSKQKVVTKWMTTKILLIDEISMISSKIMTILDKIGRNIRNNDKPFGGIQVIAVGDFFQLSPVGVARGGFAFECDSWKNCFSEIFLLNEVHRQKDQRFIKILNEIRIGKPSQETIAILESKGEKLLHPNPNHVWTKLYSVNKEVDEENQKEMQKLPGKAVDFEAQDQPAENNQHDWSQGAITNELNSKTKIPEVISLKKGALVILTRNDSERNLVNGSRGRVIDFQREEGPGSTGELYPYVEFDPPPGETLPIEKLIKREVTDVSVVGKGIIERHQLPLKLAWALTVHKSQGMTLDWVECHLGQSFDYGQVYVALSRCRTIERLRIVGFKARAVKANPKVIDYYNMLEKEQKKRNLLKKAKLQQLHWRTKHMGELNASVNK